jgi:hypothetical protein
MFIRKDPPIHDKIYKGIDPVLWASSWINSVNGSKVTDLRSRMSKLGDTEVLFRGRDWTNRLTGNNTVLADEPLYPNETTLRVLESMVCYILDNYGLVTADDMLPFFELIYGRPYTKPPFPNMSYYENMLKFDTTFRAIVGSNGRGDSRLRGIEGLAEAWAIIIKGH